MTNTWYSRALATHCGAVTHGFSYAHQQQEFPTELCNFPRDPERSVAAFQSRYALLETSRPIMAAAGSARDLLVRAPLIMSLRPTSDPHPTKNTIKTTKKTAYGSTPRRTPRRCEKDG